MNWTSVVAAEQLSPGEYRVVDVDGTRIAVFNVDGQFFAVEDICSHDGAELTGLPMDGDQVICPRHGARFCVRTGAALTAPAYEPIECFPVRVEQGIIQVRDHRWD